MKELRAKRGTVSHPVSAMVSESGIATQVTNNNNTLVGSRMQAAEQSEYTGDEGYYVGDNFELNVMHGAHPLESRTAPPT